MKMSMRLAVEIVLLTAFASLAMTNAATHIVGGTGGRWSIPTSNGFYNTWASGINFTVGDILVFNFATGAHDVATVTKVNYDDCDDDTPIALVSTGPASINLTTAGMNYFICTIGDHCEGGQKLAVNVSAATSGTTPSPPSATPSPPPTGSTSPPSGSTSPPSPPSPTTGTTSPPPPPAGGKSAAVRAASGGSFLMGLVGTVVMGMMMG